MPSLLGKCASSAVMMAACDSNTECFLPESVSPSIRVTSPAMVRNRLLRSRALSSLSGADNSASNCARKESRSLAISFFSFCSVLYAAIPFCNRSFVLLSSTCSALNESAFIDAWVLRSISSKRNGGFWPGSCFSIHIFKSVCRTVIRAFATWSPSATVRPSLPCGSSLFWIASYIFSAFSRKQGHCGKAVIGGNNSAPVSFRMRASCSIKPHQRNAASIGL